MRRLVPLLFVLPAFALLAAPGVAGAKPKHTVKPVAPVAPVAAPIVGIADQKESIFTDPRFTALGIRYARYYVAWDALRTPWQVLELEDWLKVAQANGVEPLITFGPSRLPGMRRAWPTTAQFVEQFKAFRSRYPWITTFATWNEANFCGFGPCKEPQRVAKWWLALQAACPTCKVLAAEVLDQPSAPIWVKAFIKAAKRRPAYWGLHNYLTANRLQTDRTQAFLDATKTGEVWFTETGGIVKRNNGSTVKLPEGVRHAADVTSFIFKTLAPLSPRITRVYVYQWNSLAGTSWDSGIIAPNGRVRPALDVLKRAIAKQKPNRTPPGRTEFPVPVLPVQVPALPPPLPAPAPDPAPSDPAQAPASTPAQ